MGAMEADYHLKSSHDNFGLKWKIFDVKEKTYLMNKLISFVPVSLQIIDEVIVLIYTRFHFVGVGFHCLHICSTLNIVYISAVHLTLFTHLQYI